jgi:hypothetical protein
MDRLEHFTKTQLDTNNSGSSVSIHGDIQSPRSFDSYCDTKNHHNSKRNRYNKYIQSIIATLSAITIPYTITPSYASGDIGGVSATANPVANSSGSVTNQAIQVLQGPYMTNTFGDGISCQVPTANITPYATRTGSWTDPYEDYWLDPVYNSLDANDDGVPDNPGEILFYKPVRTGQKSNQNINLGFSATISFSLDKKARELCKEAATLHNEYRAQLTANKRLDFELARLKNCGELMKSGITFHPKSPYASICADVVVNNVNTIKNHSHSIPSGNASDLKEISIGTSSSKN